MDLTGGVFAKRVGGARGQGKPRLRTLGRARRGPEEAGGPRQFEKARHAFTERGERCRVQRASRNLWVLNTP